MNREVGSYDEDNTGTARFEGDDAGLPESPIYSNFLSGDRVGHKARG